MARNLFTSESVTEGHPDKICDQVSDAVLDAVLAEDPQSRVACECACTTGLMLVMGELTTNCYVDIPGLARKVICDIGYTDSALGFDGNTAAVLVALDAQSSDIALGVDKALEFRSGAQSDAFSTGAGDQGMMFGFACDETQERMPLPISLAHAVTRRLALVRKEGIVNYLRPDGKSQVTVEYEDNVPVRVDTIVVSSQHSPDVSTKELERGIIEKVIMPSIPQNLIDDKTRILINPTGRFVIGGPHGDSGLTGRKIIVDTYGGYARHGGGAFSGKDATKVDRSAAYAARYVAKNIVAAGIARRCEIQLAYAIGVAKPVSIMVDTFKSGTVENAALEAMIEKVFDLRPEAIISRLGLRKPVFFKTAAYGHFGNPDFAWEQEDSVDDILNALG